MLILSRHPDEGIRIEVPGHEPIEVYYVDHKDTKIRLGVKAPLDTDIIRIDSMGVSQIRKPKPLHQANTTSRRHSA